MEGLTAWQRLCQQISCCARTTSRDVRQSLSPSESRYVLKVRRLRTGDKLGLFDGQGWGALAEIEESEGGVIAVSVIESVVEEPTETPVSLVIPLIKGERMDWCLQKLTEMGVHEICIYDADHGVVRLDEKRRNKRAERFAEIVAAASRQSRRLFTPEVRWLGALSVETPLSGVTYAARLGGHPPLEVEFDGSGASQWVIGPEGGFSKREREVLDERGVSVSLGRTVLRAETAALVTAARACAKIP